MSAALRLEPENLAMQLAAARARLAMGDRDAYRKIRDQLLARADQAQDPTIVNNLIWACVLSPEPLADSDRTVRLLEGIVAKEPKKHAYVNTLGFVLYRANRLDETVRRLNEAVAVHDKGGHPLDWLGLAMAHHRLGRPDQAADYLSKADQWLAQNRANNKLTWQERLELRLLRDEAGTLVKGAPPHSGN
jgi:tetratricopeptide (TPR) repeat protein